MSNTEKLLTALINGEDVSNFKCRSRIEQYLKKCCMKETCEDMTPQSRVEYLLGELSKVVCEGGSGGGSSSGSAKIVVPAGWQGTAVPNNEMVNTIYINNKLSAEEIFKVIDTSAGAEGGKCIFADETEKIMVIYYLFGSDEDEKVYLLAIGNENTEEIYQYGVAWSLTNGYQITDMGNGTTLIESFEVNSINISPHDTTGITSLFSITPFTQDNEVIELSGEYDGNKINITDNGVIDIEEMIGEKKIPLKVNVNIPTPEGYIKPEGNIEITENGTHNVSQYESATVNVASSGEGSSLKKLLDFTKSTYYLFSENKSEDVSGVIKYDDTSNVEKMDYMFYKCSNLVSAPLLNTGNVSSMNFVFDSCSNLVTVPQLDTSNATQLQGTFQNCYALQTIPLLNTNKVTNMYKLFSGCSNLVTVPQLDTSKVTDMRIMFSGCNNLVTLPQMNTDNVTTLYRTFYNCYKLEKIDITSVDKLSSTDQMAANCYSLKKIIIRSMTKIPSLNTSAFTNCYHLTGTVDSTYNPNGDKDCYIYVPDNMVDSLKAATNWSTYADQIKPLSELVED